MHFIDAYMKATDIGTAPEIFRKWTALCTVSAILDRQVWTAIKKGIPLFPNLFVLLVGPPGTGKGMALSPGRALLDTQSHVELAPSSTSYEKLINILSERNSDFDTPASLSLFLPEWGTFMRKPENDFCAMMADIYDCKSYEHQVLSRDMDVADNLYVTICGCCTPAWFAEGFPPNSYEQGLPTRFHFIYSDPMPETEDSDFVFDETPANPLDDPVTNSLFPLLNKISGVRGFVGWSVDAGREFNLWKKNKFAPRPSDPMLSGYCTRRPMHAAKIALLYAVSRHPSVPVIQLDDLNSALETLFEAEIQMPRALNAAGGNAYQLRSNGIVDFIVARFRHSKGKAIPEWEVRQQLTKLVPPQMVRPIIDELINSKRIKAVPGTKAPLRELKPGVISK